MMKQESFSARMFGPPKRDPEGWTWRKFAHALVREPAKLTMTGGDGPGGGYSIPEPLAHELMDDLYAAGVVWPRCRVVPMPSGRKSLWGFDCEGASSGTVYGGVAINWTAEGATMTAQDFALRSVSLRANKLSCLTQVSNELLADGGPEFERGLKSALVTAASWALDRAVIRGTGAGQPLGILNAPCLVSLADPGTIVTGSLPLFYLARMVVLMHRSCLAGASWIASTDAMGALIYAYSPAIQDILDTSHGDTAKYRTPPLEREPTVLSRPLLFSEHMESVGTEGDIALVDLSRYALGIAKNITVQTSSHSQFSSDLTEFRLTMRVDGQPLMSQAYTPANGGDDQSMIVTFATRS